MRIKVTGECESARALRGLLRKAGFVVSDALPEVGPVAGYTITIEESDQSGWIHVDSVDGELEAAVLRQITKLSTHPVSLDRPGGQVHSERELRVVVPAGDAAQQHAVEFGVLRGLLEVCAPKPDQPAETPRASAAAEDKSAQAHAAPEGAWWRRLWAR
jgi:hypothetical protein